MKTYLEFQLENLEKFELNFENIKRASEHGFAVIIMGSPGSGKEFFCRKVIEESGKAPFIIASDCLDVSDISGFPVPVQTPDGLQTQRTRGLFDTLPENCVPIILGLERSRIADKIGMALTVWIRSNPNRTAFIILPEGCDHLSVVNRWYYGSATGENLGLERLVVNIK